MLKIIFDRLASKQEILPSRILLKNGIKHSERNNDIVSGSMKINNKIGTFYKTIQHQQNTGVATRASGALRIVKKVIF